MRDGKADEPYKANYPGIQLDQKGRIKLDFAFITEARNKVCDLAKHINERVQAEALCLPADLVH